MSEIVDQELAEYAATWAADLDDDADELRRRAERVRGRARRQDLLRLMEVLLDTARLLKDGSGPEILGRAFDPIQDGELKAFARAWAFKLRNAAQDAEILRELLIAAAVVLDEAADPSGPKSLIPDRPALA